MSLPFVDFGQAPISPVSEDQELEAHVTLVTTSDDVESILLMVLKLFVAKNFTR